MGAINEVDRVLALSPGIVRRVDGTSIVVPATDASGFEVRLIEEKREAIVFSEGWHETFGSIEDAVGCFLWCLTRSCRLRVIRYGERPYRWTLESLRDGEWVSHGTTALLFFPFWRKRQLVYLQNAHMDMQPSPPGDAPHTAGIDSKASSRSRFEAWLIRIFVIVVLLAVTRFFWSSIHQVLSPTPQAKPDVAKRLDEAPRSAHPFSRSACLFDSECQPGYKCRFSAPGALATGECVKVDASLPNATVNKDAKVPPR